MPVAVRCVGRITDHNVCPMKAVRLRHINGQPYTLCNFHLRLPLPLLRLEPPLDWEGVQRVYREAHPRARRDGA